MPKMTLKMEKGNAELAELERFWEEVEEHARNPAYAKTAKFTHRHLTGKA